MTDTNIPLGQQLTPQIPLPPSTNASLVALLQEIQAMCTNYQPAGSGTVLDTGLTAALTSIAQSAAAAVAAYKPTT